MSSEIKMVDLDNGRGPQPYYKNTWLAFLGEDAEGKKQWFRCPDGDPRGRFLLCAKDSGINANYPPDSWDSRFPLAPPLDEKTRQAAEAENARFFQHTWVDGRAPWVQDRDKV